jgi:uncharacterized membrane protein HdeD (DUF308 family)
MNRLTTPSRIDTEALERETGSGWAWFIVLGVALIVLGAFAFLNLPLTGTMSVYGVGTAMLIGALALLGTTLLVPRRKGIGLLALSAILYGVAGAFAIVNPTLAATPLTLLLAFALIFSGITRIRLTSIMPSSRGWGWVAVSGIVSVVCGLVIIHFLLANAVWLLGVALAVDLTFQGVVAVAFGLALRAISGATREILECGSSSRTCSTTTERCSRY